MKCVSETYKYRARASPYNKMPSTVDCEAPLLSLGIIWVAFFSRCQRYRLLTGVLEEESAPSAQASNTDRLLTSFLEPFLERPFADVFSLDRRRSR